MYNYVMLIGIFTDFKYNCNQDIAEITLKVQKPFKNSEGTFEYDLIPVKCPTYFYSILFEKIKASTNKEFKIGIKGRVEMSNKNVTIVADKIIFMEDLNV